MLTATWTILCASAPYILSGFVLAGLLDAFVSTQRMATWLAGHRPRTVFLAALVGTPLPLCSCGVLPTAVALRRKGAGKGATLSFLISTPETGVTSILLTYGLLGLPMAIIRPIAACLTAISAGLIENWFDRRSSARTPASATSAPAVAPAVKSCCHGDTPVALGAALPMASVAPAPAKSCCHTDAAESAAIPHAAATSWPQRIVQATRFAFVQLYDDVFGWIVIGILAAGIIQSWLPPDILQHALGGPWRSMLMMAVIGVPLYICAEASTPIAAALIAQGVSPGAALVLLLVGPATNIGSIGALRPLLGFRAMVVYLATIVGFALACGAVVNYLFASPRIGLHLHVAHTHLLPSWLSIGSAVLFLALGVATIVRRRFGQRAVAWLLGRLGRGTQPSSPSLRVMSAPSARSLSSKRS